MSPASVMLGAAVLSVSARRASPSRLAPPYLSVAPARSVDCSRAYQQWESALRKSNCLTDTTPLLLKGTVQSTDPPSARTWKMDEFE